MSKSFSKIKIKETGVEIGFISHVSVEEDVKNVHTEIKSQVKPHQSFFKAFQNLKRFAIGYMELSMFKTNIEPHILDQYVVTAINIYEDMDTVKVKISVNKELSNKKMFSITTPLIDLYDEDYVELSELESAYQDLLAEAEEYLEGKNGDTQIKIDFKAA